ncbi:MAG: hypothetical protein HYY16_12810 [Planctomycetes bacterium]|nr:hypothetical protein [Planctomycetota bacterium]
MRLTDVPLAELFAGKNWVVRYRQGEDRNNPEVAEVAGEFGRNDYGLFSSMARFADGSEHPALAVKAMAYGGEHTDTFIYTRMGWLNILAEGFTRAIGKYAHDVFPFDVFVAEPWKGDREIGTNADLHRQAFRNSLDRLKSLRYDSWTGTQRRPSAS